MKEMRPEDRAEIESWVALIVSIAVLAFQIGMAVST